MDLISRPVNETLSRMCRLNFVIAHPMTKTNDNNIQIRELLYRSTIFTFFGISIHEIFCPLNVRAACNSLSNHVGVVS